MKKKYLLTLLPFMTLASCGVSTQVGTYKFMLGKEGQPETQIGVEATLTDEVFQCKVFKPVKTEVASYDELSSIPIPIIGDIVKVRHDTHAFPEKAIYDFSFYEYTQNGPDYGYTLIGQERPSDPELVPIQGTKKFTATLSIGKDMETLNPEIIACLEKGFVGYYYYPEVDTIDPKYGKRFNVGFVLDENSILGIESIYSYLSDNSSFDVSNTIRKLFDDLPFPTAGMDLSSYIFATYCDNNSLTLKLPVSLNDLQNQLTWYGLYADMDPYMKNKISVFDLKDFLTHLEEILSAIKFKDLSTVCRNAGTGVEAPITMPGPAKEVRFGTNPVVPDAKNPEDKRDNEVDLMNRYYAPYFSSTYTYAQADDYLSKNGVITKVEKKDDSGVADSKYYYMALKGSSTNPTYEGVKEASLDAQILINVLGIREFTRVIIDFDAANDEYAGTLIKGIYRYSELAQDHKGAALDFESIYDEPFVFKSYHTLPLTLTRSK